MTTTKTKFPSKTAVCDRHGDYQSLNYLGRVWSRCPACTDEEKARIEAQEREQELGRKRHQWAKALGFSAIPERFQDRTLSSYEATTRDQKHALQFAQRYADGFDDVLLTGRCALFLGRPGTGKTHLAIGIALSIMERGHSALFVTAQRAIRRVKDTWRRGSDETETQAVAALVYPDLLILDEIGVQHGSDTEKLILFDVLNERYEQRKPTVLLSNLPIDEVKLYLGERIFDRIREDGGEYVAFTWDSHRGN